MTKLSINTNKKAEEFFAPLIFLIFGYFLTIFCFYIYGDLVVTSDSAADLILARLLNREGGILTHNFFYSTELIIIDTQFIFKLALKVFPNDWHMARVFAHMILLAMYLGTMAVFVKAAKIGPKGLWGVAFCAYPIGFYYTINLSWSMFYSINGVISFLLLAVLFVALRKDDKVWLYTSVLFVLSFISGIRTLRTIAQLNIPLFLSAAILLFCRKFKKHFGFADHRVRDYDKKLMLYSSLMLFESIVGYGFNELYLSKKYTYTQYSGSVWEDFSIVRILDSVRDYIACHGWHSNVSIISLEGISSAVSIVFGLSVLLSVILLFFRFADRLSDEEYLFVLFTLVTLVVCAFILSHTSVCLPYHWVPVMPFGYICLAIALKYISIDFKLTRNIKGGLFVGLIVFIVSLSWILVPSATQEDNMDRRAYIDLITEMENKGYTKGVGSYWNSNVATELTDGRVEMWAFSSVDSVTPFCWLQEKSHATFPEGDVFVILSMEEYSQFSGDIREYVESYNEYYVVLTFEDGTDYASILNNAYIGS